MMKKTFPATTLINIFSGALMFGGFLIDFLKLDIKNRGLVILACFVFAFILCLVNYFCEKNALYLFLGIGILIFYIAILTLSGTDLLPSTQSENSNQRIPQQSIEMAPTASLLPQQTHSPTPASSLTSTPTPTPTPTPTITLILAPTSNPLPPQQVVEPTEYEQNIPQPQIKASVDKGKTYSEEGEYLNDDLGERMTFTCRKVLVPEKAWDEELSKSELKTIASQWVDVVIVLPDGMDAVIFSGGIKQDQKSYTEGILVKLEDSGTYTFRIMNGEIVIWYRNQDDYQYNDLLRILNQVAYGNDDTKRKLKLQAISSNLLATIPSNYINRDSLKQIEIPFAY